MAAAVPDLLAAHAFDRLEAFRLMFVIYAIVGLVVWGLYRPLPKPSARTTAAPSAALGPSRGIVVRWQASFRSTLSRAELMVQSLLALWLYKRFDVSLITAGTFFLGRPVNGRIASCGRLGSNRIGLLNTMVFTHIPSSLA